MKAWIAFWNILLKDMRSYYLKPPNISWGLIFPLAWTAMFFVRSGSGLESIPGLLPGVMRERIIGERNAVEKAFDVDELRRADEILLTNSVRGVVQACWIDQVVLLGR